MTDLRAEWERLRPGLGYSDLDAKVGAFVDRLLAALPAEHAPPDGPWKVVSPSAYGGANNPYAKDWIVRSGTRPGHSAIVGSEAEAIAVRDALNGGSRPALAGTLATDASLRECAQDLLRESPDTVGERVAIERLRFALERAALSGDQESKLWKPPAWPKGKTP